MKKKLSRCKTGVTYTIVNIIGNKETSDFLFNLGCSVGEEITIISKIASNYIINIKDGRYGIDEKMAKLIEVEH